MAGTSMGPRKVCDAPSSSADGELDACARYCARLRRRHKTNNGARGEPNPRDTGAVQATARQRQHAVERTAPVRGGTATQWRGNCGIPKRVLINVSQIGVLGKNFSGQR